jgi:hypothetical protein
MQWLLNIPGDGISNLLMKGSKRPFFQELKNMILTMVSPEEDFRVMNICQEKVPAGGLNYAR